MNAIEYAIARVDAMEAVAETFREKAEPPMNLKAFLNAIEDSKIQASVVVCDRGHIQPVTRIQATGSVVMLVCRERPTKEREEETHARNPVIHCRDLAVHQHDSGLTSHRQAEPSTILD